MHLEFDCRHRYASGFELAAQFNAGPGITALFGPSGSGKSTTLGLIAGLISPDTGVIRLNDRVLYDGAAGTDLRPEHRGVGLCSQDDLLFPHLTIRSNLLYGHRRRPRREIDPERVVQILELAPLLDRRPHSLSGGQRQRTALGRALLRGPDLLLMDEPLAGLEQSLKDRILGYLERVVAEWQIPTLFVSHGQSDVLRLAEQVIILEGGRLLDTGPTRPTLDRAALRGTPVSSGPLNLLRVDQVEAEADHWVGRVGAQRLFLPPGNYRAGTMYVQFFPHDVTLARQPLLHVSARNQLQGEVREIVPVGTKVFASIDIGAAIWAEVTPDAARELELAPGSRVNCLLKTSALQPLE